MSAKGDTKITLYHTGGISISKNQNKHWSKPELISYTNITKKPVSDFRKPHGINISSHDLSLLRLLDVTLHRL